MWNRDNFALDRVQEELSEGFLNITNLLYSLASQMDNIENKLGNTENRLGNMENRLAAVQQLLKRPDSDQERQRGKPNFVRRFWNFMVDLPRRINTGLRRKTHANGD
jgi:uncharacterized membrane-anchored protein YhcB (DUF1043 family)